MSWTVERFLNEWDVLLSPMPWLIEGLENSAKKSIASSAVAAFELRKEVARCRAWRSKTAVQIDEEFMKTVIVPLIRMHPRAGGDGELLPWSSDHQDRRGPKVLTPQGELEVVLSYLERSLSRLSREVEMWEVTDMDEPITQVKRSLVAHKIVMLEAMQEVRAREADRLTLVIDVHKAMKHLTSVGIPCSKIGVDVFWSRLLAAIWGVEPSCMYSVTRKVKKLGSKNRG
ncbi:MULTISPECIES: hypothetical protein [Aeromonas]|uniref:hypothetical protein n=1 Tax=Aeromonas TaxID=642 RepID=UPI002443E0E1|nr:hypothetical protein [Aeromonas veronii]